MLSNSLVEWLRVQTNSYGKIKKKYVPGLTFFKEELICRGADIRWEICATKWIGLAYSWKAKKKIVLQCRAFAFFYFVFIGISK